MFKKVVSTILLLLIVTSSMTFFVMADDFEDVMSIDEDAAPIVFEDSCDDAPEAMVAEQTENDVGDVLYACKIGTTQYETLADAFANAAKGNTITLLRDIDGEYDIDVKKNVTLQLYGYSISANARGVIFNVASGVNFKIASSRNGSKLVNSFSNRNSGVISCDDKTATVTVASAKLTVAHTGEKGFLLSDGNAVFSAGNFQGAINTETGSITGGYYSIEPDTVLLGDGCYIKENSSTTYPWCVIPGLTVQLTSRALEGDVTITNLKGGGWYSEGESVEILSGDVLGYKFIGWYFDDNGTLSAEPVTTDYKYSFTMGSESVKYVAMYKLDTTLKLTINSSGFRYSLDDGLTWSAVQSFISNVYDTNLDFVLKYDGPDNTVFKGWVNSCGKFMSKNPDRYAFTLVSDTTLEGLYETVDYSSSLIVFVSESYQVLASEAFSKLTTEKIPAAPTFLGKTFAGWSIDGKAGVLTADELVAKVNDKIAAGLKYIVVKAVYEDDLSEVAVNVLNVIADTNIVADMDSENWIVSGEPVKNPGTLSKYIDITADENCEGKEFVCFATLDNGTIVPLSYSTSVRYRCESDCTIYAIYADAKAEAVPTVSMILGKVTQKDEKYLFTFTASRNVPEGYELLEQGILYTTDAKLGYDFSKVADNLNINSSLSAKFVSSGKKPCDVTTLTIKGVGSPEMNLFARGYIVYRNLSTNNIGILYSGICYGNYNTYAANGTLVLNG